MKRIVIALSLMSIVVLAAWLMATWLTSTSVPQESRAAVCQGSRFRGDSEEFAGYGWSIHPETGTAVRQALAKFPPQGAAKADITFVFYTSQHAPEKVARAVRGNSGPGTQVCGWSSDFGVIGSDGYHCGPEGTLGLLCMRLPGVKMGVGGAGLDEAESPSACAKLALRRAIERVAGVGPGSEPSIIIMSATYDGQEETYVESLREALGPAVPVLGGTAAGSEVKGPPTCSLIANGTVIRRGVMFAVMYSELPFRWSFRGGFDRTSTSGVVTASDGRLVREIDGRPAVEAYDEWCGGRLSEAMRAGKNMNTFTGLYPLCRTLTSAKGTRNLFVHAWPTRDRAGSGCLATSANLWRGDVVHFSEGSWNILLNRIGLLAQRARADDPEAVPAAGLFVCCEAVLRNIPDGQRDQMAHLINRNMKAAPWIGMFTWGEQGNFPGIGNCHGNLLTSMTLFPRPGGSAKRK